MKIGIISAVENELEPILSVLESSIVREKAGLRIYEGSIDGVEAAAVVCGVCKVNAAMTAQILIDFCGADIIINSGTAGGMDARLKVFDTVIPRNIRVSEAPSHGLPVMLHDKRCRGAVAYVNLVDEYLAKNNK